VRLFAGLHLVAFIALLAGFFLPLPVASPLLAAVFLAMNLIPLAFLHGLNSHLYFRRATAPLDCEELGEFAEMYGISARELEIVAQILTGRTNAEIAERLFISVSTAKNHIHNIYRKCGIRNRVELTMLVNESGDDSS
jgi:DNA-binding CsgD family transcriptional regulator